MRHNQILTGEELQSEARKAIEAAEGETQASVARTLGVTRSAINRALTDTAPSRYVATLSRIIEVLTDYEIETSTTHRVKRKRR